MNLNSSFVFLVSHPLNLYRSIIYHTKFHNIILSASKSIIFGGDQPGHFLCCLHKIYFKHLNIVLPFGDCLLHNEPGFRKGCFSHNLMNTTRR